jgi:serine phosphatase RsbU (regulator of sigma subunit)
LGLVGVAIGWALTHRAATLTSPQFVTAYGSTLSLCALFTAILLIWRARLIGDASSARIAAAFAYSVPLVVAYAMTFPGVVPAFGSQREASGWIWFGWRIGWAVALAWYALGRPRPRGDLRRSVLVALLCSAGTIALAFSGRLPDWYVLGSGAHLQGALVAYLITVAVTVSALGCVLRMKPMTTLNAWLVVPLFANIAVGILGVFDRARFGGSADASRLLAVASSVVIVWALVSEFARLLVRASSLDADIDVQRRAHDRLAELYGREREIANTLQRALIPEDLPLAPGLLLHAGYRSAQEPERVGGDWYDAFSLSDGRVFISLGDVTGHGIMAVQLMSRFRNTIIAAALRESDPGAILTAANRRLLQTAMREPVLGTAVCGLVDPITREIAYATAGHPAPILVQPGGGAQLLEYGGLPIGLEDHVYHTHVARALGSALLVFYTDGLIEFTRDIVAGEASLLEATLEIARGDVENPALAIKQRILGDASPNDDVAILTVSFDSGKTVR